jgi:hypothetical protein
MDTFLQELIPGRVQTGDEKFVPVARYYPAMDYFLYLREDVSYRSDRVDGALTLLWHPYEDRLVGIMLKEFRALFQQVKPALDDQEFLPIATLIAEALLHGGAEALMSAVEGERREKLRQKYQVAIVFVAGFRVASQELKRAA